jgi:uncharacterized protein YyaL (SSP411 family)
MRFLSVFACLLAPIVAQEAQPATQAKPKHVNHLVGETSPYLLSHRNNPVNWYPWGPEALEKAKKEDKPIFLSIGYSACHWCHVMERESFESEDIAKVMNAHFVCIKVDREERPDLDQIYMSAVQRITGRGGWPMSVWLTPDRKPFYGGTYFPPEDANGMPGFKSLLQRVATVWKQDRAALEKNGDQLVTYLKDSLIPKSKPGKLSSEILKKAAVQSASRWDQEFGGFASAPRFAPKFPHASELSALLLQYARNGDKEALRCAEQSLMGMRNGGIYDQVGGGFHRYSTDRKWLVPHFEKMLYDNALLVQTYLEAYRQTNKEFYAGVARETLDYMLREMQSPEGGFFSATDADSEGVEGRFFVWRKSELDDLLGAASPLFCAAFGVTEHGNWHELPGMTVLSVVKTEDQLAEEFKVTLASVRGSLAASKAVLYEQRAKRVPPLCDDKILAAWNGMAIAAMARGYKVLGDPRYLESARRCGDFVLSSLRDEDGRLFRTWRGGKAKLAAYLPDYGYLADGFSHLFEADFDPRWLVAGKAMLKVIDKHFRDPEDHTFFYTADDHEELLARSKSVEESSIPSGAAMAITAFARIGLLLEDPGFVGIARSALEASHLYLDRAPTSVMTMVRVVDFLLQDPREVVLVGDPDAVDTQAFLRNLRHQKTITHVVTLLHDDNREALAGIVAGHLDKTAKDGKATAYVCRFGVCEAPVTDVAKLKLN